MNVNIAHSDRKDIIHRLKDLQGVEREKMSYMIKISTNVFSGSVDGEIVCVWGLVSPSVLSDQAYLWLHCTDKIKDHKFLFVRHSQRWIENALNEYKLIIGYCYKDNPQAKRWIEWLGARFEKPDYTGRMKFEITKGLK